MDSNIPETVSAGGSGDSSSLPLRLRLPGLRNLSQMASISAPVRTIKGPPGRRPILDRRKRALCRVLRQHRHTFGQIAEIVGTNAAVVRHAVENKMKTAKDDISEDRNYITSQDIKKYSLDLLSKTKVEMIDEDTKQILPVKESLEDSKMTRGHVTNMREFLGSLSIDLSKWYPDLEKQGMSTEEDVLAILGWSDERLDKLFLNLLPEMPAFHRFILVAAVVDLTNSLKNDE